MTNIIGYIPKPTLQLIANNTNKHNNRNDIDIKAVIELILVKLKERCPTIQNHIKINELWDRSKHSFDISDNLTVYYDDLNNHYHLGKWKISTIEGNPTYHSSLSCSTVINLLNI